jgi:hypothetical protein
MDERTTSRENATSQQWEHPLDFPDMEQNFSFAQKIFQTSPIIFGMLLNGTAVLLANEYKANEHIWNSI